MSYYRLIKETDTEIQISVKGIEIPNVECVRIESTNKFEKCSTTKYSYGSVS